MAGVEYMTPPTNEPSVSVSVCDLSDVTKPQANSTKSNSDLQSKARTVEQAVITNYRARKMSLYVVVRMLQAS